MHQGICMASGFWRKFRLIRTYYVHTQINYTININIHTHHQHTVHARTLHYALQYAYIHCPLDITITYSHIILLTTHTPVPVLRLPSDSYACPVKGSISKCSSVWYTSMDSPSSLAPKSFKTLGTLHSSLLFTD